MVSRSTVLAQKTSFLLVTGDEFLRRSKIESILGDLVPGELRSTNLFRIYPDELAWPSVLEQAMTASLLGGTQVFWISQVDRIKKADWSPFESYLKQARPESFFIFEAESLPRTHQLVRMADRFKAHLVFNQESAETGLSMLRAKMRRAGKELTQEAWQLLAERLGAAPQLMDQCLDQLLLYAEGEAIDEQAVEQLATQWLQYEPFDLTEALARKDMREAIKIFHYLYDITADVTSTIGLIHWQLKRIWRAKKVLARGGRQDDVARTVPIPSFRVPAFLNQVRQFDFGTLEELLEELWESDWKIKTGVCEPSVAMEVFFASVGAPFMAPGVSGRDESRLYEGL